MKILGRMWRIYRVSVIFFVRRASAVASPASGTGALLMVSRGLYIDPKYDTPSWWLCHGCRDTNSRISALEQTVLTLVNMQRVLMHGHQGWNVRHGLCHIYMIYVYIWVVYSFCLFCCLFIIVTTQFVALYKPCKPKPKPSTYDPPPTTKIPPEIRVEVNCNYYVHPNLTDIKLFA